MCVPNLVADPFTAVGLAGKRIRMVPVEDIPAALETANENRDSPGIAIVCAPSYDVAQTMAGIPGWLSLAYSRGRLHLYIMTMYHMPGHE